VEPRAAARPSSFTQELQPYRVPVPKSAQFENVDDTAPDRRQTLSASSSSSSSSSALHAASRDPLCAGLPADDDQCALSNADVSVALDAAPNDVTPMQSPSSQPPADFSRLPLLQPETQHDPTNVIVVSPLASLFRGDDTAAGTKSAATLRSEEGDDDGATCRQPLSSGWATALAAATIAGKAAAASSATKRRPNNAKSGGASFNIRASRSLFCLTMSNPIRKLSISVVEWKYPYSSGLQLHITTCLNNQGYYF